MAFTHQLFFVSAELVFKLFKVVISDLCTVPVFFFCEAINSFRTRVMSYIFWHPYVAQRSGLNLVAINKS